MSSPILITGAAGFIGFHLAQALYKAGYQVIGLDNFNTYYSVDLKLSRAQILKNCDIDVLSMDILDQNKLLTLVQEKRPSHLIHLAAQAGVRYCITHPKTYLENNVDGFLSIIEVIRKEPQVRLIYASSSSVYGNNTKIPFEEDDRTDHQASLYGVTKKMNELMAANYCKLFHLNALGLRFFTVYGPWGRPDMAYFSFTDKILKGEPIELYNFGKCARDFTYIDDIIAGIEKAISTAWQGHQVINLGNHQPVQLLTFVEILEKLLNKKANTKLVPMQLGDVPETYASIEKAQHLLQFSPKTTLAEGLGKFVEWHHDRYRNV